MSHFRGVTRLGAAAESITELRSARTVFLFHDKGNFWKVVLTLLTNELADRHFELPIQARELHFIHGCCWKSKSLNMYL